MSPPPSPPPSTPDDDNDLDIEIIKARKMREMRERAAREQTLAAAAAAAKREQGQQQQQKKKKTAREIVLAHLYDRGDEVLQHAYAQYPAQTEAIISRLAELIQSGEIRGRISGGELLSVFRSVRLPVRIDTTIKIEDHGKLVSFSDRLKQLDSDDDNEGEDEGGNNDGSGRKAGSDKSRSGKNGSDDE